jgi:hypothetical protein
MKTSTWAAVLCVLTYLAAAPQGRAQEPSPGQIQARAQIQASAESPAAAQNQAAVQSRSASSQPARDQSKAEMRSLDEQVQDVKTDVLSIAADLSRLEEKLLYPSNTQVAVFVSIAEGQMFRLDAMQINIDGQLATHYIYSFKELDALQKGGVQRIYTGNLPTGSHNIEVSVNGVTQGGKDFSHTQSFAFDKGVEPKLLGVTLTGPEAVELGEW